MIKRVIFVDEDNTGLSPLAAALLRKKAISAGNSIRSASRGMVVLFPEPVNRKVADAALVYGIALNDHQAEKLTDADFSDDVLILAMDSVSKKRVFELHNGFSSIFTLKEYVGETGDLKLPIGEGSDKYEAVCETMDRLIDHLMEKLKSEEIIE